jgi:hypothetical protein
MQAPIYSASEEMELMARLWSPSLKDDPLAFVLYTFPWGQAGTPLEHFPGPRKWQRQILADLRDHIKENNGKIDFSTARMAIASGRGIGKSALVMANDMDAIKQDRLNHHRVGKLRSAVAVSDMGRNY